MSRWSRLFPQFVGLHIERVLITAEAVHLHVRRTAATARCPSCGRRSRRIHSRYTRRLADEPLGGRVVEIQLQVRRFRCPARACPRHTFAEQAPQLAARRARCTVPLRRYLEDVGLTIGGRPGARFAKRRTITVSRTTLIRLVRALPETPARSPTVLGVDDFALRRGHRYGTVLVDVAASEIVDLLPDRSAASLATWLGAHDPPEVICRDRGGEYASGARQGAPDAIQIADRFHLQCNSSQVLERVLHRHGAALRACVREAHSVALTAESATADGQETSRAEAQPKRLRRLRRYEEVVSLQAQGLSLTAIASQVGLSRPTVRKYLQADSFPEWAPRRTGLSPGTRHGEHLRARWRDGIQDATVLWQELQARGYRGSVRTVQHAVTPWRDGPALRGRPAHRLSRPPTEATWAHRPPSAAQAAWWLLQPLTTLTATQQSMRQGLLESAPEVQQALAEILAFRRLVRERDATALEPWLKTAETSPVPEVRAFGASVQRDQAAVQAALDHAWSSGRVEGQVTKIKLVKRQMYGRGSVDLLKRRVLRAS